MFSAITNNFAHFLNTREQSQEITLVVSIKTNKTNTTKTQTTNNNNNKQDTKRVAEMTTEHTNTQEEVDAAAARGIAEVLCMLRDRLGENDSGRATIQEKLSCKHKDSEAIVNEMKERLLTELSTAEEKEMEVLLSLISDGHSLLAICETTNNNNLQTFVEKAAAALQKIRCYKVAKTEFHGTESGLKDILSIEATAKPRRLKICSYGSGNTKRTVEVTKGTLSELEAAAAEQHEQCTSAAEEVERRCDEIICALNSLQEQTNQELKAAYEAEDERIQRLIHKLSDCASKPLSEEEALELCKCCRVALLVRQTYELKTSDTASLSNLCRLSIQRVAQLPGDARPCNVKVVKMVKGRVYLNFSLFSTTAEERALRESGANNISFEAAVSGTNKRFPVDMEDRSFAYASSDFPKKHTVKV